MAERWKPVDWDEVRNSSILPLFFQEFRYRSIPAHITALLA